MRTVLTAIVAACLPVIATRPVEAGPALLFEPSTGMVLYTEHIDDQWHPASLTKIMTAYLVFKDIEAGKIELSTTIPTTDLSRRQPPSKIGLPPTAVLRIDTALKALIIKSANDVAVMLAEALGPGHDAFIARMNATAKRLGMTRTHFANPNGLPDSQQVTTARDLAKLTAAVMNEYPQYATYWATPSFQLGKIRLSSYNSLLRTFEGADGMKTGFICDSGYNIVATANRDGRRLAAVVLGEPSGDDRHIRTSSLLEHGFRMYGWKTVFNTTRIDNMPMEARPLSAHSVRHTVTSYSCGNQRSAQELQRLKRIAKAKRALRLGLAPEPDSGGEPVVIKPPRKPRPGTAAKPGDRDGTRKRKPPGPAAALMLGE